MKFERKVCSHPRLSQNGTYARCWSQDYAYCPSCSSLNSLYMKKLIGAGLEKSNSKFYLMTLSAPSFGKIHTVPHGASDKMKRCACGTFHEYGSALAGVPLNLDNYRYRDQVNWNKNSGKLFSNTIAKLEKNLPGSAWFSVREYQKRGAVHFHVIVRVDSEISPVDVVKTLRSFGSTKNKGQSWGRNIDAQLLVDGDSEQTVRYLVKISKYASKSFGKEAEKQSSEQKHFYKRLDRASLKAGLKESTVAKFGYGGNSFTQSANWSDLTKNALKEESRAWAIANNPEAAHERMQKSVEQNATELKNLAVSLGSSEDYVVPASYAALVRARVGLATPMSTSVERDLVELDCS